MGYWEYFPRSKPRAAKGGVKAQSQRGAFGKSWWAKRWIEVLEGFDIGARLARGRSYARGGQVLNIDVGDGKVTARVQGSQAKPYAVRIEVAPLPPKDWEKVVQALAEQAVFAAKLLAGEMPQDIEKVFTEAGLSLFPARSKDLTTDCSCPDWSNPCKHVAAVYYLLGEEFDRDPFLLFRLRGLGREQLLERLGKAAPAAEAAPAEEAPATPAEPLAADPTLFWAGTGLPDDVCGPVQIPPVAAGWPKRLGSLPFWKGERPLPEALEAVYRRASQRGLETFLGGS